MAISHIENIDCMEFMKRFPDKYFDLAIVDPPYGINSPNMQMGSHPNRNDGNGYPSISTANRLQRLNVGRGKLKNRILNTSKIEWDNERPPQQYFNELRRVSVNQIIWGGNYFTDMLPPSRCWICWDKLQPWENFSQFELAWTSFDGPAHMIRLSNTGGANAETKIHPTQKPTPLYVYLLDKFGNECDKILDTHLGSGSSRIAAYKLGYDFWATELDKDYFEAQENRFQKAINEPLFQTQPDKSEQSQLNFDV